MDSEKRTEGFRGEGVGDRDRLVMGIKKGTYCMVRWVLYASNESWNFTSKTRDVGSLGGTAVERLRSAQGVIPALWDRAPHQALLLGAWLLPLPLPLLVFPLWLAVSLSVSNK